MNSCKKCSAPFEVTADDLAFYDKVSPIYDGQKFPIPVPTLCPDCRQQRRLAQCNEFNLFPATCKLCNKKVITEISPDTPYTIYCKECFWSDKWSRLSYGRDFDFNRPFFEQLNELKLAMPAQNLKVQEPLLNCDYIHYAGNSKNSYLITHADFCEDCYYGYGFKQNRSCVDGFYNLHCELCYDCVDVHHCYGLNGSQDCLNCNSSTFLRDCIGCRNCFMCVGLRQKEYCILNQQYTKERYQEFMKKVDLGSYQQYQHYKKQMEDFALQHGMKFFHGNNLENCTGDYLNNCKNVSDSFDCEDVESARFVYQLVLGSKDVYDIYQFGTKLQLSYDCSIVGDSYHMLFSFGPDLSCSELTYCSDCFASKNSFGCVGLMRGNYCILNKQYTKEDYEKMVAGIIQYMQKTGEWGEFFPIWTSQFGYNQTTAQMYYPLTKTEATQQGLRWSDYETPVPQAQNLVKATDLPDNIKDVNDTILSAAIECEVSKKPFKLTAVELQFYRTQNLPLPRRNWFERHMDRFRKRNPRRFWDRNCDNCQKTIRSTFSPENPQKILCEQCYLAKTY